MRTTLAFASAVTLLALTACGRSSSDEGSRTMRPTPSPTAVATPKPDRQSVVTAAVEKALTGVYGPGGMTFQVTQKAPFWPVEPGGKLYVDYVGSDSSSLKVGLGRSSSGDFQLDEDEAARKERSTIVSTILKSLDAQGFSPRVDAGYDGVDPLKDAYSAGDVLCVIDNSENSSIGDPADGLATLECGSLAKYTTKLETYQTTKPFVDAYTAAGKRLDRGDFFTPSGKDAADVDGYETASIGINNVGVGGGALLLFWKKDESDWQFFTVTQSVLLCSEYNTVDLKAAFAGETCYTGTRESTVK